MPNSVMPGITSFASNEAAVPAPSGAEVEQPLVLRSNASPLKPEAFMADLSRAPSLTLHLLSSLLCRCHQNMPSAMSHRLHSLMTPTCGDAGLAVITQEVTAGAGAHHRVLLFAAELVTVSVV